MPPGQFRGCKRGVFALTNWNIPLRRPENLVAASKTESESSGWSEGQKLMVKYSYKANPRSPIGKELTVNQKETVYYVRGYDEHWIAVKSETGEEGFVPASYVMIVEETLSSLPWLENKKVEAKQTQETAQWKPYKSAYAPQETGGGRGGATDDDKHYCSVCEKKFNGPIPYQVHLNSKAHKEEVEIQNDRC